MYNNEQQKLFNNFDKLFNNFDTSFLGDNLLLCKNIELSLTLKEETDEVMMKFYH